MAQKYLDINGLSHLWTSIKNAFVSDVSYNSSTKKLSKTKAGTTSDLVTLATVATSGSYNDLSNKPTIPTSSADINDDTTSYRYLGVQGSSTRTVHALMGTIDMALDDLANGGQMFGISADNVTVSVNSWQVLQPRSYDVQTTFDDIDNQFGQMDNYLAPKNSPAFTGVPTAPTATAGTNTTQIATTAFVQTAVATATTGAVAYQGIAPTSFAPTNYIAGWYWIIGTAGTYCGQTCEAGDMIFCKTAGTTYSASNFDIVQTNLDITSITNAEIDTIVAS